MPRLPALAAFVQRRFGSAVQLVETQLTVPSTGQQVKGNPNRLHLLFVNHGAIYGTVTSDRPGAVDRGVRLDASGGFAEFDPEIDGEGVGYPFTIYSSGANIAVSMWETVALSDVETQP